MHLITPLGGHKNPFAMMICNGYTVDDIQNFVLMICNSYGIDAIRAKPVIPRRDIQCSALIYRRLYVIIILKYRTQKGILEWVDLTEY